jgi:ESS family glutamate:Na+ symporter
LFVDLGLAGILLLAGMLLRAHVPLLQRLFLPASVIAGLLGLGLGPNGGNWLPLSEAFATYPGILIALVFSALPFAAKRVAMVALSARLTRLLAFSSVVILLQWAVGIAVAAVALRSFWPQLHPGFGSMIAVGFVGGHGTAAAVGQVLADQGWPEATSLAMTSATVGILSAVLGGMLWVRWGVAKGEATFLTRFEDLPAATRSGLVPASQRQSTGDETVSSSSIDTLAFHLSLIATAAVAGYFASNWAAAWFDSFRLPVFCTAFVAASLLRLVLSTTRAIDYVDRRTICRLSSALTDILVVFGIASIRIEVLVEYAAPLMLLLLTGIVLCVVLIRALGPRFFHDHWFERSLFTWGWITGVTAMGIALLRIVDPRNESQALDDFGVVYLFLAPIEVGLLAVAPQMLMHGQWGWLVGAAISSAFVLVLSFRSKPMESLP